jgi:hypothetical protein
MFKRSNFPCRGRTPKEIDSKMPKWVVARKQVNYSRLTRMSTGLHRRAVTFLYQEDSEFPLPVVFRLSHFDASMP